MSTPYPSIYLKKGKERSVLRFHPWIFSGAIEQVPDVISDGDIVKVCTHEGKFLASGHYQQGSIAVRVLSFEDVIYDNNFWRKKLENAIALRKSMGLWDHPDTNMFRLVNGEGDGLSGLIIDLYDSVAVIKCYSKGVYLKRAVLTELLIELSGGKLTIVYDKSSAYISDTDLTDTDTTMDSVLTGQDISICKAQEYGLTYQIDIPGGQKTGFFIDQRENRKHLQQYARGRRVLNLFSYSGGFSLAALRGGAKWVDSVDSSETASQLARQNLQLNFHSQQNYQVITEDAYTYMNTIAEPYDLIILDPPSFAKHKKKLPKALAGYIKLNKKALSMLPKGGILYTFSCTQVVSKSDFRKALFTAAAHTGRQVRILDQLTQPADHPISMYHPEGEYLKGLVLSVS